MNYEKLYNEALERAKKQIVACGDNEGRKKMIYEIFPQLCESEDEKIRKELIRYLPYCDDIAKDTKERWISWLEKQKEQKHVEQDTETRDLWVYIREWREKFGRLPKDEDELAVCIDYVMKRQKPAEWSEKDYKMLNEIIEDVMPIGECPDYPTEEEKEYFYKGQDKVDWLKSLKDRMFPRVLR